MVPVLELSARYWVNPLMLMKHCYIAAAAAAATYSNYCRCHHCIVAPYCS
jgi:hypothetical protein